MKETLTLTAVLSDLKSIAAHHATHQTSVWFGVALGIALLAVFPCIFFESLVPAVVALPFIALFAFRYISERKKDRIAKNALNAVLTREHISISVEAFSHIAQEKIVEPWYCGKHTHYTKEVDVLYFISGGSWRIPTGSRLYDWSKTHSLSHSGLENISLRDDAFFYVSLQGYPDICYAYPCKFFDLDQTLKT